LTKNENKKLFCAMNIAMRIGRISLILTWLYLIGNLEKADTIVIFCMHEFVFGLVLLILYGLGHQRHTKNKKQLRFEKTISFGQSSLYL